MAVDAAATITREFLITTRFVGGKSKQQVVAVGDSVLAKTPVQLVPGDQLIKVRANKATFISGLTATPIQNLSNYSRGLKRVQVNRAPMGIKRVEFCAASKPGADVRARLQLVATLRTLGLVKLGGIVLTPNRAFECYSNTDNDSQFTLPDATRRNVGLEFFFAVNSGVAGGGLTIKRNRQRDGIQIRKTQIVENGIVTTNDVKLLKKITGTQTDNAEGDNISISCVVACRAPGLWVVENAAAEHGDNGAGVVISENRWTFDPGTDIIEE